MKNLRSIMLMACTLLSCCLHAQKDNTPINEPDMNKPRLFDGLPNRIPVNTDELNNLLNAPVGRLASLKLTAQSSLQFDGEVVSVSDKFENNIQSVVLRSSNFNGARLTISRIVNDDGSFSFTGRIISFKHGDLFELKNESGSYVLIKRNYYELVNE